MRYDPGTGMVITDVTKRARTDQSVKGLKKDRSEEEQHVLADRIIKNTYRVLMTRGMKGCYVYCTDGALAEHLREAMSRRMG